MVHRCFFWGHRCRNVANPGIPRHATLLKNIDLYMSLLPGTDTVSRPLPAGLPGVAPEPQQSNDPSRRDQKETTGPWPESGEAIVVGAIGSAAPWFLTGWAHELVN